MSSLQLTYSSCWCALLLTFDTKASPPLPPCFPFPSLSLSLSLLPFPPLPPFPCLSPFSPYPISLPSTSLPFLVSLPSPLLPSPSLSLSPPSSLPIDSQSVLHSGSVSCLRDQHRKIGWSGDYARRKTNPENDSVPVHDC